MYSILSLCLRLTLSGRWTTYWQRRISATYRMVFTKRSTRIPSRIFGNGWTPSRNSQPKRSVTKSKTWLINNVMGVLLELHANDQRGRNDGGTGTSASFERLQSGADTTGLQRIGGDLL